MYEIRSYQVEVITNEIVTTVFISSHTETVTDFGGYEFEPLKPAEEAEDPGAIEFQCVDGSCCLGSDLNFPSK